MASTERYEFKDLPKYSKTDLVWWETLSTIFSHTWLMPECSQSLRAKLEELLQCNVSLMVQPLRVLTPEHVQAATNVSPTLFALQLGSSQGLVLLDLEPSLAFFMIDRLLGGEGQARVHRAPTELEQAVLSFVMLQMLECLEQSFVQGREQSVTLHHIETNLDTVRTLFSAEQAWASVGIELSLGTRGGYARLLIPGSLAKTHFGEAIGQSSQTAFELERVRKHLTAMGDISVYAHIEGARLTDLSAHDLETLRPGDILLLESHTLRLEPTGHIGGSAVLRIAQGRNGFVQGSLVHEGEQTLFHLESIHIQEHPTEVAMSSEDTQAQDNLPETEGLLRDVETPVVVELGRIRMNAAQVARLHTGQTLRLPRAPNDSVDLVVGGKVFARGTLLDVDGELGIRLTQVAGQ